MSKVAVVYWSGTGNTEEMAKLVLQGIEEKGAEATLYVASEFNADVLKDYDAIAMGCPSMGAEVLEECEFEPMYQSIRKSLANKKVALFGSYGWGDGEWMRNWEADCKAVGATIVQESVIVSGEPLDDTKVACISLGSALV